MKKVEDKNRRASSQVKTGAAGNPKIPELKDFTYQEFRKISVKAPFTQSEWASVLHVSERTLQRYAKNNGSFAPINAERALQVAGIVEEGKETFGSAEKFYEWIKSGPQMLEGKLGMDSLTTAYGLQLVHTQLNRIQQGILS